MTDPEERRPRRGRRRPESDQDPVFYESLGHAIKVIRTQQKLERKDLAEAAGVSYAYLSDIETGRGRPSSNALLAIAKALGMPPHQLMLAAEGREDYRVAHRLAAEPPLTDAVAAPRARRAGRQSWFAMADQAPVPPSAPSQARAELDAALDELDTDDLEMVLDLVRRIQAQGPRQD